MADKHRDLAMREIERFVDRLKVDSERFYRIAR